jgi:hypothetical protein
VGNRNLGHKCRNAEEELVTSPQDEVIKRLELLDRRMARLEAMAGAGNADTQQVAQLRAAIAEARVMSADAAASLQASGTAMPSPEASSEMRVVSPPALGQGPVLNSSVMPALPAAPPPTLRLSPIPPKVPSEALPDLSLLDEKVEHRKGPPQKIDVRCALEEYPRICTRVQQLWGTAECEPYLNTLVIDTRGNRRGFPPPMMEELLYLGRLSRALVILSIGGDLWDNYDQVGDKR